MISSVGDDRRRRRRQHHTEIESTTATGEQGRRRDSTTLRGHYHHSPHHHPPPKPFSHHSKPSNAPTDPPLSRTDDEPTPRPTHSPPSSPPPTAPAPTLPPSLSPTTLTPSLSLVPSTSSPSDSSVPTNGPSSSPSLSMMPSLVPTVQPSIPLPSANPSANPSATQVQQVRTTCALSEDGSFIAPTNSPTAFVPDDTAPPVVPLARNQFVVDFVYQVESFQELNGDDLTGLESTMTNQVLNRVITACADNNNNNNDQDDAASQSRNDNMPNDIEIEPANLNPGRLVERSDEGSAVTRPSSSSELDSPAGSDGSGTTQGRASGTTTVSVSTTTTSRKRKRANAGVGEGSSISSSTTGSSSIEQEEDFTIVDIFDEAGGETRRQRHGRYRHRYLTDEPANADEVAIVGMASSPEDLFIPLDEIPCTDVIWSDNCQVVEGRMTVTIEAATKEVTRTLLDEDELYRALRSVMVGSSDWENPSILDVAYRGDNVTMVKAELGIFADTPLGDPSRWKDYWVPGVTIVAFLLALVLGFFVYDARWQKRQAVKEERKRKRQEAEELERLSEVGSSSDRLTNGGGGGLVVVDIDPDDYNDEGLLLMQSAMENHHMHNNNNNNSSNNHDDNKPITKYHNDGGDGGGIWGGSSSTGNTAILGASGNDSSGYRNESNASYNSKPAMLTPGGRRPSLSQSAHDIGGDSSGDVPNYHYAYPVPHSYQDSIEFVETSDSNLRRGDDDEA